MSTPEFGVTLASHPELFADNPNIMITPPDSPMSVVTEADELPSSNWRMELTAQARAEEMELTLSLPQPVGELTVQQARHEMPMGTSMRRGARSMLLANWLASAAGQAALAETVGENSGNQLPRAALELGAGSGIVTCVLGRLGWRVLATDPDPACCHLAEENATRNGLISAVSTLPLPWGATGSDDQYAHLLRAGDFDESRVPLIVLGDECPVGVYHALSGQDGLVHTLRMLLSDKALDVRLVVHAWSDRLGSGEEEAFLQRKLGDLARARAITVMRYYADATSTVPGDADGGLTVLRVRGISAERQREEEGPSLSLSWAVEWLGSFLPGSCCSVRSKARA